ncbi:hypothetical protein MOQ72_37295 [Saccharopolyspora sp. K220]|uniref:hypothetical protein n=1 Tax=Saccharopolyspora soli TaxID=2926618 RepID=UPI001F582F8D|nr:hypothetical protein [Saccharopolyspora soli]MCI2423089.1 hypothetical protein [Saccharopolyspora soli]
MTSEKLTIWNHGPFAGRLAVADGERPCVFCGAPVSIRIDGIPTTAGCYERAGRQWPEGITAHTAATAPAVAPSTAPEAVSPPRREAASRARRPEPVVSFSVEESAEVDDFLRSLRRAVRDEPQREVTREQAVAALREWHEAVQVEGDPLRFVSHPGRTGIAALQWLCARYGSMTMPEALRSPRALELTQSSAVLRVPSWVTPDVAPQPGQWVTEVDVNAQYLGATSSTLLGDGEPDELSAEQLAGVDQVALAKQPGFVVLTESPDLSGLPAHARQVFRQVATGWALPTPLATYLVRDHGVHLELSEAVVWGETTQGGKTIKRYGKRLGRWAAVFAGGRARLIEREKAGSTAAGDARKVLKLVYTTFLGGMLRSEEHNDTGSLRPDWSDQVMAQAGANMLRGLDKAANAGFVSIGGMKDSAWFATPTEDAPITPEGLQVDAVQPGKWHVNRYGEVTDAMITAHNQDNPGRLRKAIIATDKVRRGVA